MFSVAFLRRRLWTELYWPCAFYRFDIAFGTSFVIGGKGRTATGEAFVFALFCLYNALMESSTKQATVGKMLNGIIVADLDGRRLSFSRALLRSVQQFMGLFSCLSMPFTARKQTLHDLVLDTEVLPGSL